VLGELLSENTLAAMLGASRAPVRDAFVRLQMKGMVDVQPQRGTLVFQYDATELRKMCELRTVLETGALRIAMQHNRAEMIRAPEEQVAAIDGAGPLGPQAHQSYDAAFYEALSTTPSCWRSAKAATTKPWRTLSSTSTPTTAVCSPAPPSKPRTRPMTADPTASPAALFDLTGRTALITGARRGIGRAIALAFAAQGARVAVHHADTEEERCDAAAVAETITHRGGTGHCFAADFAAPGTPAKLATQVVETLGPIDILVLNASIELLEGYDTISEDRFERQITINLRAPLQLLQRLLPGMKQRGWGRVLTIGSIQQNKPHPQMLIYAGTKSAQLNWVRSLARQVGSSGVTVNNLAPGTIWTGRNDSRMSDPEQRRVMEARIPAGRLGTPDDLVGAALLLCSNAGSYINGADLFVDGGLNAT
jgi:glucose 1-dehydrogenase